MAKKATRKQEKTAYTLAIELKEIRDEINVLKKAEEGVAEELKKHMKAGEAQDLFQFSSNTSLKVADPAKAIAWAQKYAPKTIVVNPTLARKAFLSDALTGSMGTPEANGFVLNMVETLKERKQKIIEPGYDIA